MGSKADGEWVASLANSRVGRQLASHLAAVEVHNNGNGHTCACQEALGNERVFMKAMARSVYLQEPYPCGLSSKLPLYIAILNLSGEKSLVYSDNPALMRCVCAHSESLNRLELTRVLLTFENYASERTDEQMKFVLINYSMPWQCGTGSAYWHISACSVNSVAGQALQLTLDDRVLHFSSVAAAPFSGRSVVDPHESQIVIMGTNPAVLELVPDEQMQTFHECYSATSLDFDKAEEVPKDWQNAVMMSTVRDLQKGRKEDQKEIDRLRSRCANLELDKGRLQKKHKDELDALKKKHGEEMAVEEEDKRSQEQLARQQYDGLLAEMRGQVQTTKDIDSKFKKVRREHDQVLSKLAALERQGSAKDALHNAALSNHVATISNLENRLATALEKVESVRAELEKEHASRLEREGAAHEEALTKAVTTIESKERIINQLSENNERRDVEVASLKTHADEQGKRIEALAEQLAKAEEAVETQRAFAKGLQQAAKAQKALRQKEARSVRVSTHNASTATHQCASTQTDPEPEPSPTPAVGEKVIVESIPKPVCSYQGAIDVLQQLVSMSSSAPPPVVPTHPPPHAYPRPLPFPHFTPGHAPPYAFDPHGHPQYPSNYHNGRY